MATKVSNVVSFSRFRLVRPQPAAIPSSSARNDALTERLITSHADAISHLMFISSTAAGLADELRKLAPEFADMRNQSGS